MTTQPVTETQQTPPDGSQEPAKGAPSGVPQWIADALADKARQSEFLKFARSQFDEDFARHKAESERRENTWKGHATASDYWKKLDDTGRSHVGDGAANLEDAIENAVDKGVPRDLVEDHATAASVRSFTAKYLKANGGKPVPKDEPKDDTQARLAKIEAALAQGRTGNGVSEATRDFADMTKGGRGGGRENYRELLRSGKPMPSAEEIDRNTAAWLAQNAR